MEKKNLHICQLTDVEVFVVDPLGLEPRLY